MLKIIMDYCVKSQLHFLKVKLFPVYDHTQQTTVLYTVPTKAIVHHMYCHHIITLLRSSLLLRHVGHRGEKVVHLL